MIKQYLNDAFIVDLFFLSLFLSKFFHHADLLGLIICGLLGFFCFCIRRKGITGVELVLFAFLLVHTVFSVYIFIRDGFLEPIYYSFMWIFFLLNVVYCASSVNSKFLFEVTNRFVNYMIFIVLVGVVDCVLFVSLDYVSFLRAYTHDYSVESFFGNPNPFGLSSSLAFCMALSSKKMSGRHIKMALLFLGVLLSGSKMALVTIFAYVFFENSSKNQILLVFSLLSVIGVLLVNYYSHSVTGILNKRYEIWKEGFSFVSKMDFASITGLGSGTFQKYYSSNPKMGLHSFFAYLIVETGVITTLLFIFGGLLAFFVYGASSYFSLILLIVISSFTENFLLNEQIIQLVFAFSYAGMLNTHRNIKNEA